ncbi:molybdopterin cofactor-binding domain-containing protein [Bradyrhizobium vignae]|uniref:Molybdopterin-dependent oxidoreductase n=1 Tax=Bradyrhizobium vignae TaxID=1549949 RepID=A0ABS3ZR66_9BRAD|nr:molybdopterin cofactor-binding domain-containing protein [Bradyrhizobium vignae]MBP0110645.1 molybdopterin-dependent oxidoreductase [Bradyrhizobium vignae]
MFLRWIYIFRQRFFLAFVNLRLNSASELRLRAGCVERRLGGVWTDAGLSLADIAHVAYLDPLRLPPGTEPGLEAHRAHDPPPMTFSNSTHACEVRVDMETGHVAIDRYLVVEDCGTVYNPAIVRGQQQGAIAMGISGALLEEVIYDETARIAPAVLPTISWPRRSKFPRSR